MKWIILLLFQIIQSSFSRNFEYLDQMRKNFNSISIQDDIDTVNHDYLFISLIEQNQFKISHANSHDNNNNTHNPAEKVIELHYHRTLLTKGWNKHFLKINSVEAVPSPFLRAYLGGFLEGRVTYEDISNFYSNLEYNYFKNAQGLKILQDIKSFFKEVVSNLNANLTNFNTSYPREADRTYFYKLFIFYAQLQGLLRGYNYQISIEKKTNVNGSKFKTLSLEELLLIQSEGELPELMRWIRFKSNHHKPKLGERGYFQTALNIPSDDPKEVWASLMMRGRCSAMIKLIGTNGSDFSNADLLAGHTTWSDYFDAYRIYKHYQMKLSDYNGKLIEVDAAFSSYPGCLSSTDDYFLTKAGLAVMETTLDIIDMNLYDRVHSARYIPNFMKVNSATFFSQSARDWTKSFSYYNSGTYSSQWMVIDYKAFEEIKNGKGSHGLLFVLEQTPTGIAFHDLTDYLLKNSYYASFNRAFFSETNRTLHLKLISELYGDIFTLRGSARGLIFKTLNSKVKNLRGFKSVMRYNGFMLNNPDFLVDPSNHFPGQGISARFDLSPRKANLTGGIDCKITNSLMIKNLTAIIISGPTVENNPNIPLFEWKNFPAKDILHIGLPEKFNFDWLLASPENIETKNADDKYMFGE